ncbi:MAG TPA: MqnA/MqnD/SBP family protein [Anaeromyxobacteraceae bacterium]|nr:MqnA/MqnD/SBP family protein [Anaeromyxobacteraceae bacterium]
MTQVVRVAHSPDSDDAFMFFGLASGSVRAEGLEFVHELADIESLNRAALQGRYEVTALSTHAYAYLRDNYLLLDAGASMGDGYGPLVVVSESSSVRTMGELSGKQIAIPGKWTSAALALALCLPLHSAVEMDFKSVGEATARGEVEAGVIIHEGQLTAGQQGLRAIEDLGSWWKGHTGLPLPLGVNGVRKNLPMLLRERLARVLAESVAYGLEHREEALDYAMSFARGLDRQKADAFIGMYVNDWTRSLGERGREAVALFLREAAERGLVPRVTPAYQEAEG